MYTQLVNPILSTKGTVGLCLKWVQDSFRTPWAGPSAWNAWTTKVAKKHSGTPPEGVYVPIWFDGEWKGERLGHVAIYKDGTVWSSPYQIIGQNPAVLSSVAETERIYGMKYVGWSEDLGGVDIVKEDEVEHYTYKEVTDLWQAYLGWQPTEDELNWSVSVPKHEALKRILDNQDPNWPFLNDRYKEGGKDVKPYDGPQLFVKK